MIDETENKINNTRTHTNISVLVGTKERLEKNRKYPRETYDNIIVRLLDSQETRRGKKDGAL